MSIPGTCDSLVLRSVGIRNRGSENVQEGTLQKSWLTLFKLAFHENSFFCYCDHRCVAWFLLCDGYKWPDGCLLVWDLEAVETKLLSWIWVMGFLLFLLLFLTLVPALFTRASQSLSCGHQVGSFSSALRCKARPNHSVWYISLFLTLLKLIQQASVNRTHVSTVRFQALIC